MTFTGEIQKVKTEPCENSTGPAELGVHFLFRVPEKGKLNIHLGPSDKVQYIIKSLVPGQAVTASVFRTSKMPANHYVVKCSRSTKS